MDSFKYWLLMIVLIATSMILLIRPFIQSIDETLDITRAILEYRYPTEHSLI